MSPKVKSFGSCLCLDFTDFTDMWFFWWLCQFTIPFILIPWNLNLLLVFWCSEADCCLITKMSLSVSVLLNVFTRWCTLYDRVHDCSQTRRGFTRHYVKQNSTTNECFLSAYCVFQSGFSCMSCSIHIYDIVNWSPTLLISCPSNEFSFDDDHV